MSKDVIVCLIIFIVIFVVIVYVFSKTTVGLLSVLLIYIIFISYILSSRTLLTITNEKCSKHTLGKKIFQLDFESRYNIFNPSIVKNNSKFICCTRCSTLTQKNLFYHLYGQLFYKSFILFVEIDTDGSSKVVYPIHKHLKGSLEDPRMIEYKDQYVISASEYITMQNNFPVIMIYDKDYNFVKRVDYVRTDYFGKTLPINVQKNWCPFEHDGEFYVHTDTYPTWKVFQVDLMSGKMTKIIEHDIRKFFTLPPNYHLRCSTSWKIYDKNTYICGLHTKTKGKIPTIRSVLVLIDKKTLLPISSTEILCLENKKHNRIQYLSGIEVDNFNVILAYGLNDSEIIIQKVPKYRLKFISC